VSAGLVRWPLDRRKLDLTRQSRVCRRQPFACCPHTTPRCGVLWPGSYKRDICEIRDRNDPRSR
jgi:hypothetical protein